MHVTFRSSLLAGVLIASASMVTNEASADCTPGVNEVAVYQHANYGGVCSVLREGDYMNSAQLRMPNDSISSVRIGGNMQITACKHARSNVVTSRPRWLDDPQSCQTFVGNIDNLKSTRLGNDNISSASVSKRPEETVIDPSGSCKPGPDSVGLYQHNNLKGNCRILGVGSYSSSSQMNFSNDSISSIEIDPTSRIYVIACQHGKFGGRCEIIRRTDASLSDNQIGDNSISSIKVIRK
jgi:hypothetical protein